MVIAVAAAIVSNAGCIGGGPDDPSVDMTGTVQLALTTVPSDARCLRLTSDVEGRRTTRQVALTAGAASFSATLGGLPLGSQSLWGDIFNVGCSSVSSSTVATWVSDPVTVMTFLGGTPTLTLIMRRPGSVGVAVDFCAAPPCGTCSTRWNFETSGSTDGFTVYEPYPPSALNGPIVSSNTRASSGVRSLAVPISTDGGNRQSVGVRIKLCTAGTSVSASGKRLRFNVYYQPATGVACYTAPQGLNHLEFADGATTWFAGSDYQVTCNAGSWTPVEMFLDPIWASGTSVTDIGLVFRVFVPWRGTVFVDDVRFE